MLRVLFIGNSYTQRNDLPGLLAALAAAASPPVRVETDRVIENGAPLRRHWNAGEAERRIRGARWDWVVLQEQSTLPVKNAARYHGNVRLFAPVVREQGARLALYHTWARQSAPETQAILDAAVREIARETDARIVPAGAAWERVLRAGAGPALYDADGSHPTPAGSYLAACTFFAALLGQNPVGLPVPAGLKLGAEDARRLQEAAWAAVSDPIEGD